MHRKSTWRRSSSLRRCLTKDRKERLRDIGEARIAIAEYLAEPAGTSVQETAAAGGHKLRERFAWAGAVVLLLAALTVLAVIHFREIPADVPLTRLEISTPPTSEPTSLAISPDGRILAFVASAEGQQRLWLRYLDEIAAQPLLGTEGAANPFWSPNSRSIGFFAEGKLKRVDIAGGQPQVLARVHSGFGGAWNRAGVILYASSYASPLYRIPETGGESVAITRLNPPSQTGHCFPQFLLDGRHLLFFATGVDQGIYLGSLDSVETRRLMASELPGIYAPPAYLLSIHQGTLFAQGFDASHGDLADDSFAVADFVAINPSFLVGGFSVSETGMLAYRTGAGTSRRQLAWYDRAGKELGKLGAPDESNLLNPKLSPDSRRVAVDRVDQTNRDIWLIETARGVLKRFTSDATVELFPVWSHDGSRIVFSSRQKGTYDLYQKTSSGTSSDELLLDSPSNTFPYDWSSDGRFLLYVQMDPKNGRDIWVLPLFGERKPFPFLYTIFDEVMGEFSPDTRWVAYQSNESGQNEIYVQPFPGPGGNLRISTGGGTEPRWRGNGKELFYVAPDGKLMAVPIRIIGPTPEAGVPVTLFQTRIVRNPVPQRQQ